MPHVVAPLSSKFWSMSLAVYSADRELNLQIAFLTNSLRAGGKKKNNANLMTKRKVISYPIFNADDKSTPISEKVCQVLVIPHGISTEKRVVTP